MSETSVDDEYPLHDRCRWTWATQQVEALQKRDLAVIDWEQLIDEFDPRHERCDWVSQCTHAIRWMLQIEFYPADAKQISAWRAKAWRARKRLHHEHKKNPGLVRDDLDSILEESWGYARGDAVRRMAWLDTKLAWRDTGSKADNAILTKALWSRDRERWDRSVPEDCHYPFEEIAGYGPHTQHGSREPDPAVWPLGVTQKLREVFGPALTYPDDSKR
ncbi:MAG: DUF29 family protein [Bryobacterales bacterium]|nr:DUF29 family protein [Bryobacterales bacterium]MDE0261627.1 DUF29 family protein [Bryobacterales bacterium]